MLNDGISIGAIVAVNLHDNHIISHFVFTVWDHLYAAMVHKSTKNHKQEM